MDTMIPSLAVAKVETASSIYGAKPVDDLPPKKHHVHKPEPAYDSLPNPYQYHIQLTPIKDS